MVVLSERTETLVSELYSDLREILNTERTNNPELKAEFITLLYSSIGGVEHNRVSIHVSIETPSIIVETVPVSCLELAKEIQESMRSDNGQWLSASFNLFAAGSQQTAFNWDIEPKWFNKLDKTIYEEELASSPREVLPLWLSNKLAGIETPEPEPVKKSRSSKKK